MSDNCWVDNFPKGYGHRLSSGFFKLSHFLRRSERRVSKRNTGGDQRNVEERVLTARGSYCIKHGKFVFVSIQFAIFNVFVIFITFTHFKNQKFAILSNQYLQFLFGHTHFWKFWLLGKTDISWRMTSFWLWNTSIRLWEFRFIISSNY